jgi:muramoyltetrapeptide carboxypeptidase LdcA involved in peptidoglycan recycling
MSRESFCYKPKSLEAGDKIGLINPVGAMNKKYAATAIPRVTSDLERKGFIIGEPEITNKKKALVEGIQDPYILIDYHDPYLTDEEIRLNPYYINRRSFLAFNNPSSIERARLFNEAVACCHAVFPLVGNRFGMDIIHLIDYGAFRNRRPVIVTYSAASALLLILHLRTNTVVFYGPHIHFLAGGYENDYTASSFWNLLRQKGQEANSGGNKLLVLKNIYSDPEESHIPPSEKIPFFGYKTNQVPPLVAGKLTPVFLFSLKEVLEQGKTDFDPEGRILMVEADERNYDDCLAALQLAHQLTDLSKLSALVLASFIAFKPESAALRDELLDPVKIQEFVLGVRKLLKDNVPVIYGFPMGHSKYKLTIPMGVQAKLNIETGNIVLEESPFSN